MRPLITKLVIPAILLFSSSAWASRIVIVSDQPDLSKANELSQLLKETPPFKYMPNLQIQVVKVPVEDLDCDNGLGIAKRLIACNITPLQKFEIKYAATRLIVIKDSTAFGGSGSYPTITTSSPTEAAVHELLHSFGFVDEYVFSPEEAAYYCKPGFGGPNLVTFKDEPPYRNDAEARAKHAQDIPWFSKIDPRTPITVGDQLGSPKSDAIGLYPSDVCANAPEPVKAWRPQLKETIMGVIQIGKLLYIPKVTWKSIADKLDTRIDYSAK